jgi:hypothetical protein
MALILTPTEEKRIFVTGTTIEIPEIYLRLEFTCRANGKTLEIYSSTYVNKQAYLDGNSVPVNIPLNSVIADIDTLTQIQSVQVAHDLAKAQYEALGYTVTLDL